MGQGIPRPHGQVASGNKRLDRRDRRPRNSRHSVRKGSEAMASAPLPSRTIAPDSGRMRRMRRPADRRAVCARNSPACARYASHTAMPRGRVGDALVLQIVQQAIPPPHYQRAVWRGTLPAGSTTAQRATGGGGAEKMLIIVCSLCAASGSGGRRNDDVWGRPW